MKILLFDPEEYIEFVLVVPDDFNAENDLQKHKTELIKSGIIREPNKRGFLRSKDEATRRELYRESVLSRFSKIEWEYLS